MLSPDGLLVLKGNKVIYCNEAMYRLMKIDIKDDIINRLKEMVSDEGSPLLEVL